MTPDQTALAIAVAGHTILCLGVGYGIGAGRAMAFLGYGSESIGTLYSTLKPCFGERWGKFYVASHPLGSLILFFTGKGA